jgi:hypothetical protein
MSLPVLRKVVELARAGVPVVGGAPTRTPGLKDYPACDDAVKALGKELKPLPGDDLRLMLAGLGIPPDFESGPVPLHYIHRGTDDAHIYFMSNQQSKPVRAECTFRVAGKQPEIWDAVTGEIRDATAFRMAGGRTTLPLDFAARGSLFVVFREPVDADGSGKANFAEQVRVGELAGPWTVAFDPEWGGPKSIVFEELVDWTKRPTPGIRHYAGMATYHKTFDLPDAARERAGRLFLDLERVRNVARVRLNGRDLGVVWTAPWQVNITEAVEPVGNKLEVDVVNLWPNRLIGDALLPPKERLTKTNVQKFYRGKHTLFPSGLLGPVTLKVE